MGNRGTGELPVGVVESGKLKVETRGKWNGRMWESEEVRIGGNWNEGNWECEWGK